MQNLNRTQNPTHEEIAARAHTIWERSGRPEGQENDHWLQAERELSQHRQGDLQSARSGSGTDDRSAQRKRPSGY